MIIRTALPAVSLALTLALAPSVADAALVTVPPVPDATASSAAQAYLARARALPTALSLHTLRVIPWAAGTHVRLQQRVHGIPVEGGDIVVSLGPDAAPRRASGTPLVSDALDPVPTLDPDAAIAVADAVVDNLAPGARRSWAPRAELRVWVARDSGVHLAWAVDLGRAAPLSTYRVLVDAHDGAVLSARPAHRHAQANIFPQSPSNSEVEEVTLQRLTDETMLSGEYCFVGSCAAWDGECAEVTSLATPDMDGNYLYDPDPAGNDPFAEVQMYHHLDLVAHWFDETFAFAHGEPIEAIVNFELENAFFGDADGDGKAEVAFGQNAVGDFAYDSDVIYHEYVHSVFGSVTDFGFFGADEYGIDFAAGGLNEGTADLFAMVLNPDPLLGEYAGEALGLETIRDLEWDRQCPHNLFGEVHRDGEIWGAAGWNMIEDPAIGPDVTAALIYGAVSSWGSEISFDIAGHSLLTIAGDMLGEGVIDQAQHDAIADYVEDSGMPDCERVIPLDDGFVADLYMIYVGFVPGIESIPTTAQLRVDAPEDAVSVTLRVEEFVGAEEGLAFKIFARKGDFIRHDIMDLGIVQIPIPADYDHVVSGDAAGFELVIDATTELQLEPGQTYFFAVATTGTGGGGGGFLEGEIKLSASVMTADDGPATDGTDSDGMTTGDSTGVESETDAGSGTEGSSGSDSDADDKGCGCQAAAPGEKAPVGGWLAALGLLALGRRRRR